MQLKNCPNIINGAWFFVLACRAKLTVHSPFWAGKQIKQHKICPNNIQQPPKLANYNIKEGALTVWMLEKFVFNQYNQQNEWQNASFVLIEQKKRLSRMWL